MSKYIANKKKMVSELSGHLNDCNSFLVFEFNKLNCDNITELRKNLRQLNSRIVVCKNNIIERALSTSKLAAKCDLRGQNACLLSSNEEIAPLKIISKMSKDSENFKLKIAFFDNVLFDEKNIDVIHSLKGKSDMIATVACTLLQPIYKLLFILKNIKHE